MANRTKTERNQKILALWDNGKGWRQKSIAKMFKMTESAVSMVISRNRHNGLSNDANGLPKKAKE
jgi:transcriptional regulator